MKDVIIAVPLYYNARSIERIALYLKEAKPAYSYDVYICSTNSSLQGEAYSLCEKYGFFFKQRENKGGGEGIFFCIQNDKNINLQNYRYFWYFEESCEPIRQSWFNMTLEYLDAGNCIAGWDWHPVSKRRANSVKHSIVNSDNSFACIAHENTQLTPADINGVFLDGIWDTPGFRHESLTFRTCDFLDFDFPDYNDPIWELKSGWRSYGTRAERMWWSLDEVDRHGIHQKSPNIQWYIINKYKKFPSENLFFWYFRELSEKEKKSLDYNSPILFIRQLLAVASFLKNFQLRIRNHLWKLTKIN